MIQKNGRSRHFFLVMFQLFKNFIYSQFEFKIFWASKLLEDRFFESQSSEKLEYRHFNFEFKLESTWGPVMATVLVNTWIFVGSLMPNMMALNIPLLQNFIFVGTNPSTNICKYIQKHILSQRFSNFLS